MAAKIRETTKQIIRNHNGVETTDTITTGEFVKLAAAPQYVMLMAEGIDQLTQILSLGELRILMQIASKMSYDGSTTVDLSPHVRQTICENLKITRKTFSNALTGLRKHGLVLDSEDSTSSLLYVNPHYLYRGPTKLRSQKYRDFVTRQCKKYTTQLAS